MNSSTDKKRKVLLTVNNNRLSGIERFTFLTAKYLDKRRYNVTVALPTYGAFCEILRKNEIEFFIYNNKRNGRLTVTGFFYLIKNISKQKYDIIHAQAGIAPCLIGKFLGTKLLIEHKHGLDFTPEQIQKMTFIRLIYEKLKKFFVNYTLTGCESDRQILIKKFKFSGDKVIAVYNGVEIMSCDRSNKDNQDFVIGTIGRLAFQKAQSILIDAAKLLMERGHDFKFRIYGEGELRDNLLKKINELGLEKTVSLNGYTNNADETLRSFDIFVLTSLYEGIPYVILDSMNNCVPVVSTEVGGINEVVINGVNGILVESKNVQQIADAIEKLHDSKNLKEQLVKNAHNTITGKYSIQTTIDQLENVYLSESIRN